MLKSNYHKIFFVFAYCLISLSFNGCAPTDNQARPYLLLYAFDAEGDHLAGLMTIDSSESILGREARSGKLAGKDIILAESGVGMTNAAMMTQALIDKYNPRGVLFTGIAGAVDTSVNIGDIVVCDSWITHDYGYYGRNGFQSTPVTTYVSGIDSIVGEISFEIDDLYLSAAEKLAAVEFEFEKIGDRVPKLIIGGIGVSGNLFVDSPEKRLWLVEEFCALTTDMESAAVAQVCTANGVPFIIFRSASDLAGGSGSETAGRELDQFFKIAANNSSKVLVSLLSEI